MRSIPLLLAIALSNTSTVAYGAHYRGGGFTGADAPKATEYKCTSLTRRGVSVFTDISLIPPRYVGNIYTVGALNTTRLQLLQTNGAHYEIVPVAAECNGAAPMSFATYTTLVQSVTLKKV